MSLPFAHVAGTPIEEMLGACIPCWSSSVAQPLASLRARWRRVRSTSSDTGPADRRGWPPSRKDDSPRPLSGTVRVIVHQSVHYNETLDRTFFALSDPTRRGILQRLGHGPATIGELAEPFGLTLNGVKKHVGILEEVDLVVTAKVGRARECQLGPAQLEDATEWIDDYRRTWQRRLDRFGSYAEGKDAGR